MAIVGQLGTESVKGLGPGAYLVSVLPSAVLVVSIYLLFTARLYPWSAPRKGVSRGFDSIVDVLAGSSPTRVSALLAVVLVVSVLLRPLHVAAVQLLEGYWSIRTAHGTLEGLATERQLRRFARARARNQWLTAVEHGDGTDFATVVRFGRRLHRIDRLTARAGQVVDSYPLDEAAVLPTLLGNVLRRAETTAGERFGLNTVVSYPRLYPYLGQRLHDGIAVQFNLLDSAAAFTIVFWILGGFSVPTAWLGSWWFLLPVVFFLAGGLSYAGAVATARQHATLLATAYDLHRFDMLAGLHIALPKTPEDERASNEMLSGFLKYAERLVVAGPSLRPDIASSYAHPGKEDHGPEIGSALGGASSAPGAGPDADGSGNEPGDGKVSTATPG